MGEYKPYPIYDFKTGFFKYRQPWLLPTDAFKSIINGYIYHGVLQKREGSAEFGRISHFVNNEVVGTGDALGTKTFSDTLTNTPVRSGSVSVTDGVEVFTDNGDGTLTGDAGGTGTYTASSGAVSVTFNAAPGDGVSITCDYSYYPGYPIMGLIEYYGEFLTRKLMAFDTKRATLWNSALGAFEDISLSNTFTGSDDDFFRFCNTSKKILYITNGQNRIYSYNGTTLATYDIDTNGDTVNDVDTCRWIFEYKSHLVLLATTESSTYYGQRARYSAVVDYTDWPSSFYNDCPTHDEIQTACFIGDDLIVWFKFSVWKLKYTADPMLPFEWERVSEEHGCYAPMSCIRFQDRCRVLSTANLVECDGLKTFEVDLAIQDNVLDYNVAYFKYSYGARARGLRQAWTTFCAPGSVLPDRILVQNYEEGSFSVFSLATHCLGTYDEEETAILDDIADILDDLDYSFDDVSQQAGFPLILSGTHDGYVMKLNTGSSDNGAVIYFEAESAEWNPFAKNGLKARLGFIDFLVDASDDITLTVDFYNDTRAAAHTAKTLSFAGSGDKEKTWVRLHVGSVGEFHRIKLSHTAANQRPKIHAIIPWFKEAGPILK
jgi:hypothetical protein